MGKKGKAIKKALKNKYNVMFYTDEEGRRRAIKLQDEKALKNAEATLKALSSLNTVMLQQGIQPASSNSNNGNIIEINENGKTYRYTYDPNKVNEEQAKKEIETYIYLALKAAELGAMLLA